MRRHVDKTQIGIREIHESDLKYKVFKENKCKSGFTSQCA